MNKNSIIATILLAALIPCSLTSCYYYSIPTYSAPYNQAGAGDTSGKNATVPVVQPQPVAYAPTPNYAVAEPYWPFWTTLFSWALFFPWWGGGHHGGHHGGGHHGGHR